MNADILQVLGGIGLFLFGMQTMTEALRQLAGQRARALLTRFTTTPLTGAITGTLTTAAIQSSSATTVTVVGFVGAGLLTFPQAVGIIFGANIGTTVTGWMVMLLGFKLKIGLAALPLLFAGSLTRVLARGNWARAGQALAGFALVFVGLEMMQAGMAGFQGQVTPADFPPDTLLGRFEMLLLGAVITAITQSSSAGVASTLVLLGAGTISFTQAAALVIGMDIGTTVTALLATVGGSRAMRQTGLAHVAYNVVTGVVAFFLLGLIALPLRDGLMGGDNQAGLVAFHTLFNLVGVVLMLPLANPFARLVERLVPERPGPLSEALDQRLLADPGAAIDAARSCAGAISATLFAALGEALRPGAHPVALQAAVEKTEPALLDLRDYLARIVVPVDQTRPLRRYSALLHQYDHLHRLQHRCRQPERLGPVLADASLRRPALLLGAILRRPPHDDDGARLLRLYRLRRATASRMVRLRRRALSRKAGGTGESARIFALTDAMRWLDRTAAHVYSVARYDALAAQENPEELRIEE
ncbi:Na/Pi cotransporter family protein [Acidimangrovimonas pyrenivorans]|uniref:Na/Pi cotransporter family protein n=1 Tax=Acidimangrovimonas pyrenivorans TaxID=2030798 RepID=A0ABV7ALB0_9RHOB